MFHRHSIRLKGFDYSQNGWYFVTICTQNRECLFGNIVGARRDAPDDNRRDAPTYMKLNESGKIVESVWRSLPNRFPIRLDEYQIMPNHFHGIIIVHHGRDDRAPTKINDVRAIHESPLRKRSLLSQIMGYFKMNTTKQIHQIVRAHHDAPQQILLSSKIFQRNYYEHIIRNETEYIKIKQYIKQNPSLWERDRNNIM